MRLANAEAEAEKQVDRLELDLNNLKSQVSTENTYNSIALLAKLTTVGRDFSHLSWPLTATPTLLGHL